MHKLSPINISIYYTRKYLTLATYLIPSTLILYIHSILNANAGCLPKKASALPFFQTASKNEIQTEPAPSNSFQFSQTAAVRIIYRYTSVQTLGLPGRSSWIEDHRSGTTLRGLRSIEGDILRCRRNPLIYARDRVSRA